MDEPQDYRFTPNHYRKGRQPSRAAYTSMYDAAVSLDRLKAWCLRTVVCTLLVFMSAAFCVTMESYAVTSNDTSGGATPTLIVAAETPSSPGAETLAEPTTPVVSDAPFSTVADSSSEAAPAPPSVTPVPVETGAAAPQTGTDSRTIPAHDPASGQSTVVSDSTEIENSTLVQNSTFYRKRNISSILRTPITPAAGALYTYGNGHSSTGLDDLLCERLLSSSGVELSAGQFALPLDKGERPVLGSVR